MSVFEHVVFNAIAAMGSVTLLIVLGGNIRTLHTILLAVLLTLIYLYTLFKIYKKIRKKRLIKRFFIGLILLIIVNMSWFVIEGSLLHYLFAGRLSNIAFYYNKEFTEVVNAVMSLYFVMMIVFIAAMAEGYYTFMKRNKRSKIENERKRKWEDFEHRN